MSQQQKLVEISYFVFFIIAVSRKVDEIYSTIFIQNLNLETSFLKKSISQFF